MAKNSTQWFVVVAFLALIRPAHVEANFAPVRAVGGTLGAKF